MSGKMLLFLAIAATLTVSGCVANDCGGCSDVCMGDVLLVGDTCAPSGECRFTAQVCEYGCRDGLCSEQPPHFVLSDNPQQKGNFSLNVTRMWVEPSGPGEKDSYSLAIEAKNIGQGEDVFSVTSASVVAGSGIMNTAQGFTWSDMLSGGESKDISFSIRNVPAARREQKMTLVIRTNQGLYSFPAAFES